jgi:hypothetical protein
MSASCQQHVGDVTILARFQAEQVTMCTKTLAVKDAVPEYIVDIFFSLTLDGWPPAKNQPQHNIIHTPRLAAAAYHTLLLPPTLLRQRRPSRLLACPTRSVRSGALTPACAPCPPVLPAQTTPTASPLNSPTVRPHLGTAVPRRFILAQRSPTGPARSHTSPPTRLGNPPRAPQPRPRWHPP